MSLLTSAEAESRSLSGRTRETRICKTLRVCSEAFVRSGDSTLQRFSVIPSMRAEERRREVVEASGSEGRSTPVSRSKMRREMSTMYLFASSENSSTRVAS